MMISSLLQVLRPTYSGEMLVHYQENKFGKENEDILSLWLICLFFYQYRTVLISQSSASDFVVFFQYWIGYSGSFASLYKL